MFTDKWQAKLLAERRPIDILALIALVLGLLWQPDFLHQQLNFFEWGLYLPGIDALAHGQVPFRDFFHLRGPFELYAPALFMKLFGFRADMLAVYFYLGTVITMIAAALIAYELLPQRLLLYPFVLILITRTFPRSVFTFWGGMRYAWGLLAVLCLVKFLKGNRRAWAFACGLLAAVSLGTSIEIGASVLAALAVVLVFSQQCRRGLGVFTAGFLSVIIFYGLYLWSQHALPAFADAQWTVVTQMGKVFLQEAPVPDTPGKFFYSLFYPLGYAFYKMTPVYCFVFFLIFYFWRLSGKKASATDHAAMAVAVYAMVQFFSSFRNLWAAEFEMALQPEKIILFYLWSAAIAQARQRLPRLPWLPIFLGGAVFLSSIIYGIGRMETRFLKSSWAHHHKRGKQELINGAKVRAIDLPRVKHMVIPDWQADDLQELSDFVHAHVPVGQTIWTYPELGTLNFILQRPWAGHFPVATLSWMNEGWFDAYATTLKEHPPQYAIVNRKMPWYFDKIYFRVAANKAKHERIMEFLHHNYEVVGQTPTYFIYQRKH